MKKDQINCPHCNKRTIINPTCFKNVYSYGSNHFIIKCDKCKEKIYLEIYVEAFVDRSSVEIADPKSQTSFGE